MLVLHYTGMPSADAALKQLCNPEAMVSCHYFIDEDGKIIRLVQDNKRAWHAGVSFWHGVRDVNSASIGIEIVNPGHEFGYRPFPEAQMQAIEDLCADIIHRYDIKPQNVVGHSDIAPNRKEDPGELFNWERLSHRGVGLWPGNDYVTPTAVIHEKHDRDPQIALAQLRLLEIGYEMEVSEVLDNSTHLTVKAFQRRFRPARVDGLLDESTLRRIELAFQLYMS